MKNRMLNPPIGWECAPLKWMNTFFARKCSAPITRDYAGDAESYQSIVFGWNWCSKGRFVIPRKWFQSLFFTWKCRLEAQQLNFDGVLENTWKNIENGLKQKTTNHEQMVSNFMADRYFFEPHISCLLQIVFVFSEFFLQNRRIGKLKIVVNKRCKNEGWLHNSGNYLKMNFWETFCLFGSIVWSFWLMKSDEILNARRLVEILEN